MRAVKAVGLGLDLTRRGKQSELKKAGLPWTLSKSFAGAALLTPFTECDGSFSLDDIEFELAVNGEASSGEPDVLATALRRASGNVGLDVIRVYASMSV